MTATSSEEAHNTVMNPFVKRLLFWTPRILSILFLAFLSLFALDVFDEGLGVWKTLLALVIHLVPVFALILVLIVAWRWEWVGALLYGAAGAWYIAMTVGNPSLPAAIKLIWCLTIAGPALLIAVLFLFNWLYRAQLRSRRKPAEG